MLQNLAYYFPVIIELAYERNMAFNSYFSRWRKARFAPNKLHQLIYLLKKHMSNCKENCVCYQQEQLAHCLPVRIEWVFERNTFFLSEFSR
jgi:hypothetical protein